jgi:hypothetical protein
MKHAPEYLETMEKLAPLLREHRHYSGWKFDMLCDWCAYFWNRGTISYLIDDGQARGVCLVKLFKRLEQFLEPFVHEPGGKFCMVELLVARDPLAIAHTFFELTGRWGKPAIILWDRGERTEGGSPRMYRWSDYEKLTRRLTYGLIDTERQEENYGYGRRWRSTT